MEQLAEQAERYDEMVESLGGHKTPAIGFAMGVERILVALALATRQVLRNGLALLGVSQPMSM